MCRLAIVGGKLQGVEAAYLAREAGIRTVLIDKNPFVPARNLCDDFICSDILKIDDSLMIELSKADAVLPATENRQVLNMLKKLSLESGMNIVFDFDAYATTSSKLMSDALFRKNGIPSPLYYPDCRPPYIVKPSSLSGSTGVIYASNDCELESILENEKRDDMVIQEYVEGRSYSIEVIGMPGQYRTYEITEIIVDEEYDCKRVTAPCDIPMKLKEDFRGIAVKIAEIIGLKGIMDVEVIDDCGELRVLEIDARIPSQTPTVVYHSTGVNMLEDLLGIFTVGELKEIKEEKSVHVSYEHIHILGKRLMTSGEHVMGKCEFLDHINGFYGSDEALTDYRKGSSTWSGTIINKGEDVLKLELKRKEVINNICREERLEFYDSSLEN